jgi:hypothetical protein
MFVSQDGSVSEFLSIVSSTVIQVLPRDSKLVIAFERR